MSLYLLMRQQWQDYCHLEAARFDQSLRMMIGQRVPLVAGKTVVDPIHLQQAIQQQLVKVLDGVVTPCK